MKKMKQIKREDIKKVIGEKILNINLHTTEKIKFAVICVINLILCCLIFIPNRMVFPEVDYYYMQGIGAESHGDGAQRYTYSQEFIPRDSTIKTIQIDIDKNGIESGGFLNWNITDRKGNVIMGGSVPYEGVNDHSYTSLAVDKKIKFWHRYYINVSFDEVNGTYPKIIINHGEEQILEGRRLFCNGEKLEGQGFVWAIEYGECVPLRLKVRILLFSIIGAIAFLLKNKWKFWLKIVITAVSFFVITETIVYYGECIIEGPARWVSEATYLSNCRVLYLFMVGLLLISQSFKWTLRIGSIAAGILYIADFFVLRFRGGSMTVWDIMSVGTAKEVAGNYSYQISGEILLLAAFLMLIWSISYSFLIIKCKIRYHMLISIAGIIYCILLRREVVRESFWEELEGVECTTSFQQEFDSRKSGYLASLLFQLKENKLEEPEDYKRGEVKSILAEYEKEEIEERPHIIVVVNESLADMAVLGDALPEEEPLIYMKSLRENTVKGYIDVSVLGGGTCNSEFEFLTGNSMAYLPNGYYPFNALRRQQESLVWDLREMGYETYGMHPGLAESWSRNIIFPLLGFQKCYWREDFQGVESRHMGVADKETYQKVIEIYENRKSEERQFIYDLTIQNHGGYEEIDVDEVIESDYPTATEYFSLMRSSDRDLEELIEYFKKQSDEVVICIFGDHQPVLEDGFYEDVFDGNGKSEKENLLNTYRTPFWIWANYDIEEKENVEISLNYLGGLLFEAAGLPKSPYMNYISEIREEYPVLTINGYKDKEGIFYTLEKLPEPLKKYEKVQYYYMYDNGFDDWY